MDMYQLSPNSLFGDTNIAVLLCYI